MEKTHNLEVESSNPDLVQARDQALTNILQALFSLFCEQYCISRTPIGVKIHQLLFLKLKILGILY